MDQAPELEAWLRTAYGQAYRTACLVLRNPSDAEEVVQEAFLRVWRFRDSIPADEGRDRWLYRVVVNACCTRLRSDKARPVRGAGEDALAVLPSVDVGPAGAAEGSVLAAAVVNALAALPEHLRIPVVLRYYVGLPEKDIAVAIRRRPGTVKSRLHEGRRLLANNPTLAGWADLTQEA